MIIERLNMMFIFGIFLFLTISSIRAKRDPNSKEAIIDQMMEDDRLKGCERHMIELIYSEILDTQLAIKWDDIGKKNKNTSYFYI